MADPDPAGKINTNDNPIKTNLPDNTRPADEYDKENKPANEQVDQTEQALPATQITPQVTYEVNNTIPMTTPRDINNTIASLEEAIRDANRDLLTQNENEQQDKMEIEIDSDTDRLLNSSQGSLQTGLKNVLDNMKIQDDTPEENPEDDPATRRSLRIKIRLDPPEKKNNPHQPEKKNNPPQPSNEGSETNEKPKTTKKKKRSAKKQPTELEEITELKKIIKINEELIEEDDIRIRRLEDHLDNTLNELDNIREENTQLTRRNEKLEEENSNQQAIIKTLEDEQKNFNKKQNEALQAQVHDLDQITTSQKRTISNLQQELDDTKDKFNQLEGLLETMRHRNSVQEKRIAQLKRSLSSDDEKPVASKRSRQTTLKDDMDEPNRKEAKDIAPKPRDNRDNQPAATWIPPRHHNPVDKDSSPDNTPPRRQP